MSIENPDQGTILFVDDSPTTLELLFDFLTESGFKVLVARTGESAITKAEYSLPDLILLDVLMPGIDGFETCQVLKAKDSTKDIPVIFMTALDETENKVKGFNLGAVDYVTKPIHFAVLRQRVRRLIQQTQLYQQLEVANRELKRLASLDGLTGIANRRRFDEYIEAEWRRMTREKMPLSLILCDIDYFKKYNDTYGHQAGDSCLRKVANALSFCIKRSVDLVARYGGEEFAVILPNTTTAGASQVAEEIREFVNALKIPHAQSAVSEHVTLSLGVASMEPTLDTSPSMLIATADAALYRAKGAGRNRSFPQFLSVP